MNLQQRILLLTKLGEYLSAGTDEWTGVKRQAEIQNPWFTREFIDLATDNIVCSFLQKEKLETWTNDYGLTEEHVHPKNVGVVMAGNIPMVGFHDFLCVFISGHRQTIKLSSKDEVLMKHIVKKMTEWNSETARLVLFAEMLKGCDAYIATGSNNSGRYFEYYFAKYPHIIRRNRTSVAVLTGNESAEELTLLADDIHLYFGLGCRNVTKIFVPAGYNFEPLIDTCKKYNYFFEMQKYRNNYDYQLALLLMNKVDYKSTGSLLLVENQNMFTPISVLNYEYYQEKNIILETLENNNDLQCIVGESGIPFGSAQVPALNDYADGVDTMHFLCNL